VSGRNKQILTLVNVNDAEKFITINPARMDGMDAAELREMKLSVLDDVVFRKNDTGRGIYNGLTGTVKSIDLQNKTAVFTTRMGKEVDISLRKLEVMDHAYAKTIHSSQGATVERTIAVGEANREYMANLAYVACSRERRHLSIITDNVGKLKTSWGKYAEKQFALKLSKYASPDERNELAQARLDAGKELGQIGDLEKKREPITEHEQNLEAVDRGGVVVEQPTTTNQPQPGTGPQIASQERDKQDVEQQQRQQEQVRQQELARER
jgi:hypothetical protein